MRTILSSILIILTCSACFNENAKKKADEQESENWVCGTIDDSDTKIAAPAVFESKCATCHSFYKDATGPKMDGISERIPHENWLEAFITNQDSLIKIRDPYTLEVMLSQPVEFPHNYSDLSDEELTTLLDYIKQ